MYPISTVWQIKSNGRALRMERRMRLKENYILMLSSKLKSYLMSPFIFIRSIMLFSLLLIPPLNKTSYLLSWLLRITSWYLSFYCRTKRSQHIVNSGSQSTEVEPIIFWDLKCKKIISPEFLRALTRVFMKDSLSKATIMDVHLQKFSLNWRARKVFLEI